MVVSMKKFTFKQYMLMFLFSVIIAIYCLIGIKYIDEHNHSNYDTRGVPVKILDKTKVTCGYFLKRKNHSPYITYYLYDGVELYNTDPDSCDRLAQLDTIENILIVNEDRDFKTAMINTRDDRLGWFEHVLEEAKILKNIKE